MMGYMAIERQEGVFLKRISLVWLALIGLSVQLQAQAPAATFAELRSRSILDEGESIELTDDNGTIYKARFAAITGNTLVITANGVRRDLMESQVREIRHRRPDKWWNGMLIGLGAGLGAAVVGVASECGPNDSECSAITTAVFVPVFAGIGMGAGAAIDFAIRKRETVFTRKVAANRSLQFSPILAHRTTGVRVLLRF
jgi:hypothetical protein